MTTRTLSKPEDGASRDDRPSVRHLLDLATCSAQQVFAWIDRARDLRTMPRAERSQLLVGREIVHLFLEPSTRTRVSFEIAARRLGATVIDFDARESSLQKGETLRDTIDTIEAMGTDALVIRMSRAGAAEETANFSRGAVINAGDGTRAHPTQGLLDLFTLLDEFGSLEGRQVAIVGDVRHSRVARSDVAAFTLAGATVHLVGPKELQPLESPSGVEQHDHFEDLLPDLDAVVLLRVQKERLTAELDFDVESFIRDYRFDETALAKMPKHSVVLHPGPMNRGVEVTDAVADGSQSRILQQVKNGVAIRMSVLEWCLGGQK